MNKEALDWRIGYLNKEEDNTCYVCSGRGWLMETDIEADGSISRRKIKCACCSDKDVK